MPWSVAFSPENKIISYHLAGAVTLEDLETALRQGVLLSRKHDCYMFYVDAQEVEPRITLNDLFVFPKLFRPLGIPHTAKVAVYCLPRLDGAPMQRFCETVFFNNNYDIKFFIEPKLAVEWLKGAGPKLEKQTSPTPAPWSLLDGFPRGETDEDPRKR